MTGFRFNPCAAPLWGGPSGNLSDPTPNTQCWSRLHGVVHFLIFLSAILIANFLTSSIFFVCVRACGTMTYSEVLVANFESGTWIIHDSKLLNLENLEVENDTSNATHILGNLHPRQPVDPGASLERIIWMFVCFGDDSHWRDARHSHPCEDRRDAETAHQVCTVLSYLCFQLENQTS